MGVGVSGSQLYIEKLFNNYTAVHNYYRSNNGLSSITSVMTLKIIIIILVIAWKCCLSCFTFYITHLPPWDSVFRHFGMEFHLKNICSLGKTSFISRFYFIFFVKLVLLDSNHEHDLFWNSFCSPLNIK